MMKARTLLKKLTDYGLTVKIANDKIRLSPLQLINDKVLSFVRTHKNDLMCALYDVHREHKRALHQGRLEVLRILLRRFLNDAHCRDMINYQDGAVINDKSVETYLDATLIHFDYDIEVMIDIYRVYTPKPVLPTLICECGYRPPFCSCIGTQPVMVTCNQEINEYAKSPSIVARDILDSKMTLEQILIKSKSINIELLEEDVEFLKKCHTHAPQDKRGRLLATYVYHWLTVMKKEPLPQKKQNIGRFAANTFLRESLANH